MVRNRNTAKILGTVAVGSALALALTGCGRDGGGGGGDGDASPGITDDAITLGVTTPLSGGTAGPGNCTVAGLVAYMGQKNADGGIEFGDGKTREVKVEAFDDTYDPQKALQNFQQNESDVFAFTSGLGTPTNLAYREAAIDDEVPQVLVQTGDPIFSDQEESPWQLGFVPTYLNEGEAFGQLLADSGDDLTVAILSQNDDYGEGYVEGFKSAIEGSGIEVVEELTYEATDTSVDAQLTELAATDADVFFNAMSITPLVISAIEKTRELSWSPSWFLPSNTSSPTAILEAGQGERGRRLLHGRVREGASVPRVRGGRGREAVRLRSRGVLGQVHDDARLPALHVELHGRRDARRGLPEDGVADARVVHGGPAVDRRPAGAADARRHLGEHDGGRPAGRVQPGRAEVQRQGLRHRRQLLIR